MITLIESKTDINCIEEGIISTQYYEKKIIQQLYGANSQKLKINHKITKT